MTKLKWYRHNITGRLCYSQRSVINGCFDGRFALVNDGGVIIDTLDRWELPKHWTMVEVESCKYSQ